MVSVGGAFSYRVVYVTLFRDMPSSSSFSWPGPLSCVLLPFSCLSFLDIVSWVVQTLFSVKEQIVCIVGMIVIVMVMGGVVLERLWRRGISNASVPLPSCKH